MQGPLPHPHRQDAPTHEHQLEGVDGAPQMAPARSGHKLPDRVKVHRPFEPTCRDAHGYQSSREQISAAQPDGHFVFAAVGPGEVRDERGGGGLALDRRVHGVERRERRNVGRALTRGGHSSRQRLAPSRHLKLHHAAGHIFHLALALVVDALGAGVEVELLDLGHARIGQ